MSLDDAGRQIVKYRNRDIVFMWEQHDTTGARRWTMAEIAAHFSLHRETIRLIIRDHERNT